LNNEEYNEFLSERLHKMEELRDVSKSIASGIVGDTLLQEDLFFTAALDRSIALLHPGQRDRNTVSS